MSLKISPNSHNNEIVNYPLVNIKDSISSVPSSFESVKKLFKSLLVKPKEMQNYIKNNVYQVILDRITTTAQAIKNGVSNVISSVKNAMSKVKDRFSNHSKSNLHISNASMTQDPVVESEKVDRTQEIKKTDSLDNQTIIEDSEEKDSEEESLEEENEATTDELLQSHTTIIPPSSKSVLIEDSEDESSEEEEQDMIITEPQPDTTAVPLSSVIEPKIETTIFSESSEPSANGKMEGESSDEKEEKDTTVTEPSKSDPVAPLISEVVIIEDPEEEVAEDGSSDEENETKIQESLEPVSIDESEVEEKTSTNAALTSLNELKDGIVQNGLPFIENLIETVNELPVASTASNLTDSDPSEEKLEKNLIEVIEPVVPVVTSEVTVNKLPVASTASNLTDSVSSEVKSNESPLIDLNFSNKEKEEASSPSKEHSSEYEGLNSLFE